MNRRIIIENLCQNMEELIKVIHGKNLDKVLPGKPTVAQVRLMLILFHEGKQSLKSLAERAQITSSASTQLTNELVKNGFLSRIEDSIDRRKLQLEMTEKGKSVFVEILKQRAKDSLEIFTALTDEELAQLEKIQKKVTNRLREMRLNNINKK